MKTLCVTGHRPDGLPWKKDTLSEEYQQFKSRLKEYLNYAIEMGYTHFIAGGALGIDTIFALTVIELKQSGLNISLEIAVPCKTQPSGWNEENKRTYDYILKNEDKVTVLSDKYYLFCMQRRNEYMVENSDRVLCCYNGVKKGGTYNTIKLAQKQGKKLLHVDLSQNAKNGGNQMIFFKDKII